MDGRSSGVDMHLVTNFQAITRAGCCVCNGEMSKWAAHPRRADRVGPSKSGSPLPGTFMGESRKCLGKFRFCQKIIRHLARGRESGARARVRRGAPPCPSRPLGERKRVPTAHRTAESRMEGSARGRDALRGRSGASRGLRPPRSVRPDGLSTHLGSAVRRGMSHPGPPVTRATHAELQKSPQSAAVE